MVTSGLVLDPSWVTQLVVIGNYQLDQVIKFYLDKIRQQKGQLSVSQRSRGDSNASGISVKNSSSIRTLEEMQARISLLEGENAQLQRKITEKDRIIGTVT